jgi:F-type H+-transporting ATPase subunit a
MAIMMLIIRRYHETPMLPAACLSALLCPLLVWPFASPFGVNTIELLKLIPFVGSISVFVLLSNLLSVIPVLAAPTAQVTVPLACAILTFLYFNWQGIKRHGIVGYLKHFAGPVAWLSPLIFPVEIISTSARILSLTVRLWANIVASDLLYTIFLSLFTSATIAAWSKSPVFGVVIAVLPATIPLAFIGLHIFVAIIQSYIFTVLPSVYLGMATADEH